MRRRSRHCSAQDPHATSTKHNRTSAASIKSKTTGRGELEDLNILISTGKVSPFCSRYLNPPSPDY